MKTQSSNPKNDVSLSETKEIDVIALIKQKNFTDPTLLLPNNPFKKLILLLNMMSKINKVWADQCHAFIPQSLHSCINYIIGAIVKALNYISPDNLNKLDFNFFFC